MAVRLPVPTPLKTIVAFLQIATGGELSCMVMIPEQEDEFPLLSVTIKVSLIEPTFAQVNEVLERLSKLIVQLSVELLFTCPGVRVTLPVPSKNKVTFRQLAIGFRVSRTVTCEEQVD